MGELNPGAGPQLYGMPRGASPLESIIRGAGPAESASRGA